MPFVLVGVGPVILGLFALLIVLGVVILATLIDQAGKQFSINAVFGGAISALAQGITAAAHAVEGFFVSIARGVVSWFTAAPHALLVLIDSVQWTFFRHIALIRNLFADVVPNLFRTISATASLVLNYCVGVAQNLFSQAMNFTHAVYSIVSIALANSVAALNSFINSVYHTLANAISSAYAILAADAVAKYQAAIGYTSAYGAAILGHVGVVAGQLQAYANGLAQWAMATAYGAAVDWAKTYNDQTLARSKAATDALARVGAMPAWPYAIPAIDAISLAYPESIAAAMARVGTIPRAIPIDAGALAGAAVAVGTIALDWIKDCGISICKNTKGFGNELAALEDAALITAIIELVAEALRDPEGAADVFRRDIVSPLESAGHEVAQMVGIGG